MFENGAEAFIIELIKSFVYQQIHRVVVCDSIKIEDINNIQIVGKFKTTDKLEYKFILHTTGRLILACES